MIILNNNYYKMSIAIVTFNIINFILSSVLIYVYYYLDYRSITVLITNFILIIDKLINCFNVSNKSVEEMLPISAYMTTPVVFNTIDNDYKHKNEIKLVEQKTE